MAFGGSAFGTMGMSSQPQTAFGFGTQQTSQQPATFGTSGTLGGGGGSAFGQNTSLFGSTSTPAFGSTAAAPTFGSSGAAPAFGSTAAAPSFGGFGTAAPQTASAFGFGAPQQQSTQPATGGFGTSSAFGQPTSSAFGATQPTSAFGSFGAAQQQQPSTGFGFGTTQAQAPSTGFGTSTGFGQTSSLFGSTATPAFGGGSFGATAAQPAFGQGSSTAFGAPKPSAFAFPSFNTGTTPSLFGQPQQQQTLMLQQQPQQPQIDEGQAFQQSVFQCHKFGDERDSALAALNYLQACWGSGKGYYSQTMPPTNYNQQNAFYRFKAVGYAFIYTDNNEDGLVVINFKKSQEKITGEETTLVTAIQNMLGRPNIVIRFSGTKAISEESTVVIIFAEDRNTLRRVPATDLSSALCQPHLKAQLENMGVTNINAKVKPSPEQIKRYLENPPDGIDPRVWNKAQEDNPDSNSMIPVPLVGVDALKNRIEWQEKETLQHHARLKMIGDDVASLLNRHSNMTAELQQMRRKHVVLSHRLISIICRQELMRKQGTTLQPEEEILKRKLEEMDSDLNSPTHYKGRLNELLSQIRLHKSSLDGRPIPRYNIDPSSLIPVKEFLIIQQEGVKHLVATIKTDEETVKEMSASINKMLIKIPS